MTVILHSENRSVDSPCKISLPIIKKIFFLDDSLSKHVLLCVFKKVGKKHTRFILHSTSL